MSQKLSFDPCPFPVKGAHTQVTEKEIGETPWDLPEVVQLLGNRVRIYAATRRILPTKRMSKITPLGDRTGRHLMLSSGGNRTDKAE